MSRRIYITFSGAKYDRTTALACDRAPRMGADEVWVYDDRWLVEETDLYANNRWLWECKGLGNPNGGRGFGWFCWKPYIIMHALAQLEPGDMVLYVDADTYPIHDFSVLFDLCEKEGGHLAFMATGRERPLYHRQWVKRECYQCMGLDTEEYWHGPHAVARFMVFRKPYKAVGLPTFDALARIDEILDGTAHFLHEWYCHCLCPNCQTFDHDPAIQLPGPKGDGPQAGFREHRTEQAIYSLLCQKYGRRLYREACEFGKDCPQDWDLYPQLFAQECCAGNRNNLNGSAYRNIRQVQPVS